MPKLSDDETYLKKYENLSRGEKQELDLAKRNRLAEAQAEADAGDSFSQRAGDVAGRVLRGAAELTGSTSAKAAQQEAEDLTAKRDSERQRRLQEAKDSANYAERDRGLYISNTPGKIKDNMASFKKGGKIKQKSTASKRADGCAIRGHTKGRVV
jgi:hypothetical protein